MSKQRDIEEISNDHLARILEGFDPVRQGIADRDGAIILGKYDIELLRKILDEAARRLYML